MFYTTFERIENAFILTVIYGIYRKQWSFRYYEELVVMRAGLEHDFVEGNLDDLKEVML
jgi:hypothetical protein